MKLRYFALLFAAAALSAQPRPGADLGFTDTPVLPGQKWHVHDPARPYPPVVTPGAKPGDPPSDAIVLFDGKDLSKWAQAGRGADAGKTVDAKWPVKDGYFEVGPGTGPLMTREKFGDIQLHIEWSEPPDVKGSSQGRGNSGVLVMGLYEIQVLDTYHNPTYADGHAAAIYGQWPPLANVARPVVLVRLVDCRRVELAPLRLVDGGEQKPLVAREFLAAAVGACRMHDRHQVFVGVDPGHLDVDARELGVVARRDERVRPEDGADLEDPLEAGAHGHLLVELGRLGQVSDAVEVLDGEELTP